VCTNKKAVLLVTRHGIGLERATIDGKLDLSSIRVPFPLVLKNCFLAKDVKLRNACIGALDMTGTQAAKVDAKALHVDGDIVLKNGFKAKGPVILAGATIGGNLDFTNAILTSASRGNALDCERVTVKGKALLCSDSHHKTGFTANGGVSLAHAWIGGNLVCKRGVFLNPEKHALLATGLQVEGSVYLNNGFRAKGSVGFVDAKINRSLECNNGEFINPDGMALDCERLNAGGDVFFCEGHWGNDPKAPVDCFKALGEVKLVNARIGGNLECKRGKFINSDGNALLARGLTVLGNVFLRNGFRAKGSVGLVDATINGNLECNNGEFINPGGMALDCERLNAGGDVFFCERKGQRSDDPNAKVKSFEAQGTVSFVCAEIRGYFSWLDVNSPDKVTLDLRYAKVGILSRLHRKLAYRRETASGGIPLRFD
jgi:sRNA-binding regulator protein Hfq